MRKIVALGATSLIAQETLKNFAKDKDSFFLIGRNEEKLNEVAKNLEVLGASEVNVKVVKDVCDFKAHQEIINEVAPKATIFLILKFPYKNFLTIIHSSPKT